MRGQWKRLKIWTRIKRLKNKIETGMDMWNRLAAVRGEEGV